MINANFKHRSERAWTAPSAIVWTFSVLMVSEIRLVRNQIETRFKEPIPHYTKKRKKLSHFDCSLSYSGHFQLRLPQKAIKILRFFHNVKYEIPPRRSLRYCVHVWLACRIDKRNLHRGGDFSNSVFRMILWLNRFVSIIIMITYIVIHHIKWEKLIPSLDRNCYRNYSF